MILPGDREIPGDTNFIRRPLKIREDADKRAGNYGPKGNPYVKDTSCIDAAVEMKKVKLNFLVLTNTSISYIFI
ncbi:hypothetical protein [Clostridium pasteurianum]|uniref:Uncharacterized protein n=1 Tax=Clostridium pasteurianum BC1 TaxID=86416 RepID=R4K8J1_CLOPA|nr:hypothetical protein [Clostridium pasteurianum]AGK98883.1 hypothetical protein Clopa_4150 [Clostridium pasteurianum BC1]